jgi:NitT/TauT family transport system substrate-binding protein
MFKGQITPQDFKDEMDNADLTYDVTAEHIDITLAFMPTRHRQAQSAY